MSQRGATRGGRSNGRGFNQKPPGNANKQKVVSRGPPEDHDIIKEPLQGKKPQSSGRAVAAMELSAEEKKVYGQMMDLDTGVMLYGEDFRTRHDADEFKAKLHSFLISYWSGNKNTINLYRTTFAIASQTACLFRGQKGLNTNKIWSCMMLDYFDKWLKWKEGGSTNEEQIQHFLTPDIKREIFGTFSHCNVAKVMALVFKNAQLPKDSHLFKKDIESQVYLRDYKKACDLASALCLYNFPIDDFVIPLFLQEKVTLVETYIEGQKDLAVDIVSWLDDLTVDNYVKLSDLSRRYEISNKSTRLTGKPLGKLIEKFIDMYGVPPETAKNHFREKTVNSFRYLVGQKDDSNMRLENWRDLVFHKVQDCPFLLPMLIDMVNAGTRYLMADPEEAAYWAKRMNAPTESLPYAVRSIVENDGLNNKMQELVVREEEDWDNEVPVPAKTPGTSVLQTSMHEEDWDAADLLDTGNEFHKFKLSKDRIRFVDTAAKFHACLDALDSADLAGVDSEFRPKTMMESDQVGLLQIATRDEVFLLDMVALLGGELTDSEVKELSESFFKNAAIRKLGYAFTAGDFSVLANSHPVFADLGKDYKSMVDVDILARKVTNNAHNKLFDLPFESTNRGLAALVEETFGKPLDKRDQVSDWSKRPLSEHQIVYAALDAHVLIELYDEFERLAAKEDNDPFFRSTAELMFDNKNKVDTSKLKKKVKKSKEARDQEKAELEARRVENFIPLNSKAITPDQLKVVCDSMLQGLCKKLRLRGVDAVAIDNSDHHELCGKISKDQDRMILTRGSHFQTLKRFTAKGHCLQLFTDKPEDQVEEVFRYFNVEGGDDYLFSRCVLCNGGKYFTMTREVLQKLVEAKNEQNALVGATGTVDYDDELDDEQEFLDYEDTEELDDRRPWLMLGDVSVHKKTGQTSEGVELKIGEVPTGVIEKQAEFYGCTTCGKIYWQGSHWDKVTKKN